MFRPPSIVAGTDTYRFASSRDTANREPSGS